MDYLNRAVEVAEMAVNSTPEEHPYRAGWLNNLGNWFGGQFTRTGSIVDLNRAQIIPRRYYAIMGILSNTTSLYWL